MAVMSKDRIFQRMGDRWFIKWTFLRDIYSLMQNDLRFSSMRSGNGIRYAKVSKHLKDSYQIELNPKQLKYLVFLVKTQKVKE